MRPHHRSAASINSGAPRRLAPAYYRRYPCGEDTAARRDCRERRGGAGSCCQRRGNGADPVSRPRTTACIIFTLVGPRFSAVRAMVAEASAAAPATPMRPPRRAALLWRWPGSMLALTLATVINVLITRVIDSPIMEAPRAVTPAHYGMAAVLAWLLLCAGGVAALVACFCSLCRCMPPAVPAAAMVALSVVNAAISLSDSSIMLNRDSVVGRNRRSDAAFITAALQLATMGVAIGQFAAWLLECAWAACRVALQDRPHHD